jgi:hypothetical protein
MSHIIKRSHEFAEAQFVQEAKKFAISASKLFNKNGWEWGDLDTSKPGYPGIINRHIPSVTELEKELLDLYKFHKQDWTESGMESGRLRVRCRDGSCCLFVTD